MVGPSPSDRNRFKWIRPAIVALVGVSSGLITLVGNATVTETALVVFAGLLLGGLLAKIVVPSGRRRER
ncbi:hypothetical protein [Halocatena pleomorpha]|uniref:Uncharacterized protein n=1 Tax=Halocatena pleomorpha TaxID=1785090 RepID=A0A3P3RJ53_9EURY|nr:hypothetical protein [Halocatena pleomorpha]RRJ33541.1 hypothetical protein EIK79_01710 [Halocatena pleomorpha]